MMLVWCLVVGLYCAIVVLLAAAWALWTAAKRFNKVTGKLERAAEGNRTTDERVWHIQEHPIWIDHGDRTLH